VKHDGQARVALQAMNLLSCTLAESHFAAKALTSSCTKTSLKHELDNLLMSVLLQPSSEWADFGSDQNQVISKMRIKLLKLRKAQALRPFELSKVKNRAKMRVDVG